MGHPSKFFADDKDIYDLLMSQRRRLGDDVLRRFLRERGIVVGPTLEREHLVAYLSRLPFGWQDLQALLERVGSVAHRAPHTSSEAVAVTVDQIEAAAQAVQEERGERRGEVYKVIRRPDGSLEVQLAYSVLDTTKNRLRQRSQQHATIAIDPGPSGVRVRYPEEERAREVAEAIIFRALGDPKEHVRETISLDGCSPAQRTMFFEKLMQGIAGFSLRTVTRAGFRRLDDKTSDSELDGESDGAGLPGEEDDAGARILRVQLDGAGVFSSTEFQALKSSGFYVSATVWRSRMDGGEGLDAEFEARFEVEVDPLEWLAALESEGATAVVKELEYVDVAFRGGITGVLAIRGHGDVRDASSKIVGERPRVVHRVQAQLGHAGGESTVVALERNGRAQIQVDDFESMRTLLGRALVRAGEMPGSASVR